MIAILRRRFEFRSLLMLLALSIFLYALGICFIYFRMPGDNLGIYIGNQVLINSAPVETGFRTGDAVRAVAGVDTDTGLLLPGYWRKQLAAADGVLNYTLDRQGKEVRIALALTRPTLGTFLRQGITLFFASVALIAVATVLFSARGQGFATRLLGLAFLLLALNQVNNILSLGSVNVFLTWAWVFLPLDFLSIWLAVATAFHAILLFPEAKPLIQRHPRLVGLIYLVVPFLLALVMAFNNAGGLLALRAAVFNLINPWLGMQIAGIIAALVHTYFTSKRTGIRNQIRWIIWGLAVAALPWTLLYMLPTLFSGKPLAPLSLTNIVIILIPISFAVAIFRYGLMEIDRIINRTLVYTTLSVLLGGVYLLAVNITSRIIRQQTGARDDFLTGIIAAVVMFLLFDPLRSYTQRLVDRTFYREQLNFAQAMRQLSQKLSDTIQMRDVVTLLNDQVAERLRLTQATLLLLDDSRRVYASADTPNLQFSFDSPLVRWLLVEDTTLIMYKLERMAAGVRRAALPLVERRIELCIPLHYHNDLIGLYLLGAKVSGNLFTREEVNAIDLFAHQIAASLQNARLYQALQNYNQQLEKNVAIRTEELLAERDRLDTILQNIADALVVTAVDERILLVNPVFLRHVGGAEAGVLGSRLRDVFPVPGLSALLGQALATPGRVFTADLADEIVPGGPAPRFYRASACALLQRRVQTEERSAPLTPEISGVVTVLRDITRETEVDRMKTDFISMVSHELRTPLTSILGFTKLIARTFERDFAPRVAADDRQGQRARRRVQENLDIILSEGDRLTRLINDVLDIAKMEAGKVDWHMEPTEVADVIESAVAATSALAENKQLAVWVKLAEPLPTLCADRDRLVQVVNNLLSNAIKFTERGHIEIRATQVQVLPDGTVLYPSGEIADPPHCVAPGEWLAVSVHDTGVGIMREDYERVFDKFRQVGDWMVQRAKGSGLGLSICKEIIQEHGGIIWVESVPDEGSTFTFLLPVATPLSRETANEATAYAPPEPYTTGMLGPVVLVVDDESNIRSLLHQELGEAGYLIVESADGTDALHKARELQPALIVLDLMLPDVSGFDVASALKSDSVTQSIPIIMLSVLEEREKGLRLGADAYLLKPFEVVEVVRTADRLLGRVRD